MTENSERIGENTEKDILIIRINAFLLNRIMTNVESLLH